MDMRVYMHMGVPCSLRCTALLMPTWLSHAGTIAAEQEDPDASYKLAYMHKVGRGGLSQDDAAAAALEQVSAEQVFICSCCTLSRH